MKAQLSGIIICITDLLALYMTWFWPGPTYMMTYTVRASFED